MHDACQDGCHRISKQLRKKIAHVIPIPPLWEVFRKKKASVCMSPDGCICSFQ